MATEVEPGSVNARPGREHPEGEELYKLFSDAAFEALAVHDRGSILAANRAFADLFGYELGEVAGMDAIDLAAPESRDTLIGNLGSDREETFRAMALRKDGTSFTAEVRGKVVRYRGGRVQVAAIRDLTGQVLAEKAVRELQEMVLRLVEGLPVAVVIYDASGRPRYANGLFEGLTGVSLETLGPEVTGEKLSETFNLYEEGTDLPYPEDRSPLVRALSGTASTAEDVEIARQDRRVPVEVSAAPIFDETGEVAHAVAGIFQSTPGGESLTANPSKARIWGYESAEEMVEAVDDISKLYTDPPQAGGVKRLIEENESIQGFEAEMYREDGSRMWTSINARAVRGERREVLFYEGTIEDVTDRKKAEQKIIDSEGRYRTLVETSPDAILIIDLNYRITTANKRAAEMLGFESLERMVGTGVLDHIAPEDRVRAYDDVIKAIRGDRVTRIEFTLMRRDGSRFPGEVSVAAVYGAAGIATAFITIIRDVTRRKRDEETLRNIDEVARAISGGANRTTALIGDLLVLAEEGQRPKDVGPVDVSGVVRTIRPHRPPGGSHLPRERQRFGDTGTHPRQRIPAVFQGGNGADRHRPCHRREDHQGL